MNEQTKENLKTLWIEYQKNNEDRIKERTKSAILVQKEWKKYKEKIINNKFTLEDYTNRLESGKKYLCYFIETESKPFGSSRPAGSANTFMVKMNKSERDFYTVQYKKDEKNKKYIKIEIKKNTREQANEIFKNDILNPLLEKIIIRNDSDYDLNNVIDIIEDSRYGAKQLLRKIATLENPNRFLLIYANQSIEDLYKAFFPNNKMKKHLEMSQEVLNKAKTILNIESNELYDALMLSGFLWEYASTKIISDEGSPNVIFYGAPGTGKTYNVTNKLDFICKGNRDRYKLLQFHPSFTYEDFIEGIKPKGVTANGNINFEMVNGIFKNFCMEAKKECEKAEQENRQPEPYFFVVDEINRANLSAVFGETLSRLEKDYRHKNMQSVDNLIETQNSSLIAKLIEEHKENQEYQSYLKLAYHYENGKVYFGVPKNVYFIGMMNDVDKSIDTFDLALRRRFKWIRMDCDYEVIKETKFRNDKDDFNNIESYARCAEALNSFINENLGLGSSYEFGHSFFMKIKDVASSKTISNSNLETLFNLYMKPTLKEYLRAFYPEVEIEGKNGKGGKLKEALEVFQKPLGKNKTEAGSDNES